MKNRILKFIATSANSYELADRIVEMVEELMLEVIGEKEPRMEEGFAKATTDYCRNELRIEQLKTLKEILYPTPATPKDSRRDVGKGKKVLCNIHNRILIGKSKCIDCEKSEG